MINVVVVLPRIRWFFLPSVKQQLRGRRAKSKVIPSRISWYEHVEQVVFPSVVLLLMSSTSATCLICHQRSYFTSYDIRVSFLSPLLLACRSLSWLRRVFHLKKNLETEGCFVTNLLSCCLKRTGNETNMMYIRMSC